MLDKEDAEDFKQEIEEAVDRIFLDVFGNEDANERQGGERAAWRNFTPDSFKKLVPGEGKRHRTYIVWQRTHCTFNAYYEGGTPKHSTRKPWGGEA
eukprot:8786893-Karenia_brevis.AAC.1